MFLNFYALIPKLRFRNISFRKIAVQQNGLMKWSVIASVANGLKILVGAVIWSMTVRGLFGIITSAEM